ncbi:hypothetical protein ACTFIU_004393 [Dictyostelium citrinum]
MYQVKVENNHQEIKMEERSREELMDTIIDLESTIANLEDLNASNASEANALRKRMEELENKLSDLTLKLITEKNLKEEYKTSNYSLAEQKGSMMERIKINGELLEKEKEINKELQRKYDELLEKFNVHKVVEATEANQQPKERKGKTTAVSTTELAQVTEQFINDGPEAAMMNAEWIFSKSNEFDVLSRLHYLVNNVFRRTGETRDPVLKVASLLSNVIQSKEIPTWNRVVEMIISSIDTNKRREMVWKEFEKLRADGLKADGSNYEMYVLTWNKASMYWESLSKDQRFREICKGLDHSTTIEVLRNKHGLTQQQFEESDEKLWFTWIKDAIRTISAALEIRQNRSESNKFNSC